MTTSQTIRANSLRELGEMLIAAAELSNEGTHAPVLAITNTNEGGYVVTLFPESSGNYLQGRRIAR